MKHIRLFEEATYEEIKSYIKSLIDWKAVYFIDSVLLNCQDKDDDVYTNLNVCVPYDGESLSILWNDKGGYLQSYNKKEELEDWYKRYGIVYSIEIGDYDAVEGSKYNKGITGIIKSSPITILLMNIAKKHTVLYLD